MNKLHNTTLDKAFGIHQQAMLLRGKRATVLASNIANADTPNYKAKDMDFNAILKSAGQTLRQSHVNMKTTSSKHMATSANQHGQIHIMGTSADLKYRVPYQSSLDGNTVETQAEKARFSENSVRYQASVQFLSGKIKGLLSALRGE